MSRSIMMWCMIFPILYLSLSWRAILANHYSRLTIILHHANRDIHTL
jgi:hypothetical protein